MKELLGVRAIGCQELLGVRHLSNNDIIHMQKHYKYMNKVNIMELNKNFECINEKELEMINGVSKKIMILVMV